MPRTYSEAEIVRIICYTTMTAWQFGYARRAEWTIWGARHQACSTCSVPAYSPCLNMSDRKQGRPPRVNKQPHEPRVDWNRILEGLKTRGYYRPAIEKKVRKMAQDGKSLDSVTFESDPRDMPEWAK